MRRTRTSIRDVEDVFDVEEQLSTKMFDEYQRAFWNTLPRQKTIGCANVDSLLFAMYVQN